VRFVAALEQSGERLLACQFHPELSGAYGAALLERWLAGAQAAPAPALAGSTPGLLPRVVPCLDVRDGRVVKGVQFQHLRDAGDPASQAALYESQGADEIVLLDVAASAEGRATQLETVARVRAAIRIPLTVGGGVRSVDDARGLGAGEILLTSWDRDGTRAGPDLELLRAVLGAVRVPVIASGGIGEREHVAEAFRAGADAVLAASVFHDGDETVDGIKADLSLR